MMNDESFNPDPRKTARQALDAMWQDEQLFIDHVKRLEIAAMNQISAHQKRYVGLRNYLLSFDPYGV